MKRTIEKDIERMEKVAEETQSNPFFSETAKAMEEIAKKAREEMGE